MLSTATHENSAAIYSLREASNLLGIHGGGGIIYLIEPENQAGRTVVNVVPFLHPSYTVYLEAGAQSAFICEKIIVFAGIDGIRYA